MEIASGLVRSLLETQFPEWAALPIRPIARQGNDNRTFRLGDELTVRLPSAEAYAAGISKEDLSLPILSAHISAAELPQIVATGSPSDLFPFPWSIRRWLHGSRPAEGTDLDRVALVKGLGRFRRVPTAGGPACGRCHPSVYADQVQQRTRDTPRIGAAVGWNLAADSLLTLVLAAHCHTPEAEVTHREYLY